MTTGTRKIAVVAVILFLGILAVFWWPDRPATPDTPGDGSAATQPVRPTDARPTVSVAAATAVPDGQDMVSLPGRDEMIAELNSPNSTIEGDLGIVAEVVSTYLSIFKMVPPGGLNDEITANLTGSNPGRIAFIPATHPSINATGELTDRWGTPLFFHPVSDNILDLRSAGPDGELWTDDDVTLTRSDPQQSGYLGSPQ